MERTTAICLVIVIVIAVLLYRSGALEPMSGIGGGPVSDINDHRRITLHYTNWCGACTNMKPIWAGVKLNLANSGIEFNEVDEDVAKTPYITSFPTIIMLTEKGKRLKYPGGADFDKLRNWCMSPFTFVS